MKSKTCTSVGLLLPLANPKVGLGEGGTIGESLHNWMVRETGRQPAVTKSSPLQNLLDRLPSQGQLTHRTRRRRIEQRSLSSKQSNEWPNVLLHWG